MQKYGLGPDNKVFLRKLYVQSKMKTNTVISPLLRKDGQMAVSDADKADVLNTFFSSVLTRENTTNIPHIEFS